MTFAEWYATQRHRLSNEQVCRMIWDVAAGEEREECAKVCDAKYEEWSGRSYPPPKILLTLADAIRMRSND